LSVFERVRSQLRLVDCAVTDRKGTAALSFDGEKGASYLIMVAQLASSVPGTFAVSAYAPEPPAVPPGSPLPRRGARATVDVLVDRDDAYAVEMRAGTTYRIALSTSDDRCLGLAIFKPKTRSFAAVPPVRTFDCGGYTTFTPGPDGGGVYSLVVRAAGERGAVTYRLRVAKAGPDDVGPGLPLGNGVTRYGSLSGIDAVDLYRFDVKRSSDVDVRVSSRSGFAATLLAEHGRRLATVGSERLRIRLRPGRYFVALRAGRGAGRYAVRVLAREITATTVVASSRALSLGSTLVVSGHVAPSSADGGRVRIEVDYLDPLAGWVFNRLFVGRVAGGGAAVRWTPPKLGRWRIKAVFLGNGAASPSESRYAIVDVR
jgi:hypothetical protein